MGQHHLHTMLRAAPGLRALGGGRVTFQQSDERQDMRKCGVAQRGAFCREGGMAFWEEEEYGRSNETKKIFTTQIIMMV